MRTVTIEKQVFKYAELNEEAQEVVQNDTCTFFVEILCQQALDKKEAKEKLDDFEKRLVKAYKKSEEMRTPWFIGEYIVEYCEAEILEVCNDYEYDENGNIFIED